MRRVSGVEAGGELGDAPGLGDAARTGHIGLDQPERAILQHRQGLGGDIVALAGRKPDRQMLGEAAIAGAVMRRDRLLEKAIAEIGQRPADDQRIVDVIGPVGIDIERDIVAGELADEACPRDCVLERVAELDLDLAEAGLRAQPQPRPRPWRRRAS